MSVKKETLLSFIAAVLIPCTPMIAAVSNVYHELMFFSFIIWLICGILTTLLGFFAGYAVKKTGERKLHLNHRIIFAATAVIISMVCIFAAAKLNMSSLAYIFLPLAVLLWYWLGYKIGLGLNLLSNMVLGGACLEAAFLFPMCRSFDESGTAANIALAVFGAEIVICSVLLNIRHLRKITIRGNSVSALSKSTLRFNLRLTVLFAFIVIFFFIFAPFAGYWLWEGIKALIRFLLSLYRETEKFEVETYNELPRFEQWISERNSSKLLIIVLVIAVAALTLLIKPIKNAIMEMLNRRFDGIKSKKTRELTYTDFYETSEIYKSKKSSFKRAYKDFLKEKNPADKYRLGYKAFITWLEEAGEKNMPSDTTQIHLEKEEKIFGSELAERVIERYELLRYNDKAINVDDCAQMDMMLRELMRKKR